MQFKEIETKYRATNISLADFKKHVLALEPKSTLQIGSYDHYYTKSENEFLRYRDGSEPQLTVKVKSKDANNFVRTEVNLPLDGKMDSEERVRVVSAFCDTLGFKHNFTIYKSCLIYYWENCNIVYYVVYDDELKEKDRFIEIEMKEHGWPDEATAWAELVQIEKTLSSLGISSQNRLRKSLFEIFRKV